MKLQPCFSLFLVLLLTTACASLPSVVSPPASAPQAAEPTVLEPTQPSAAIANPASKNCVAQGGRLAIEERGDGGQYGVCYFEDNTQCEEWALLRGECSVGGVKVTGYSSAAARYCAITGGAYAATAKSGQPDEQGVCILVGGVQCDAADFYNGKCDASTGKAPDPTGSTLAPPPSEVCNGMAQALSEALSHANPKRALIEVTQADQPVGMTVWNEAGAAPAEGTGCRATATGTGEQFKSPSTVLDAIRAVLVGGGWQGDERQASGGPTGTGTGFRSNDLIAVAGVIWLPSTAANCPKDQPISACKVKPEQQLYTVTLDCARSAAPAATGLANPASLNCTKQGGMSRIEARPDGGQFGVCYFEDNQQCEEWALLRGECPVGGVKVTGFTTPAARFCAISGGQYDQAGTCTLKSGVKCDAEAYFAGTCSPNTATGG